MFGIGSTELLVILVIALLVLGPKNLPKIAQTLGKAMGQFQKVSKDFQRTLNTEIAIEEEVDKRKEQDRLVAEQEAKKEQKTARNLNPESSSTTTASAEKTTTASAETPDNISTTASADSNEKKSA